MSRRQALRTCLLDMLALLQDMEHHSGLSVSGQSRERAWGTGVQYVRTNEVREIMTNDVTDSDVLGLVFRDAEQDPDGTVTVSWNRGEDVVYLVCCPNGKLIRLGPGRQTPPVEIELMGLS
jgi:hypothetical protein